MRHKIYEIIEKSEDSVISGAYDVFMVIMIVLSLVPLAFKEDSTWLIIVDKVTVAVFIIDYILRWITADYKMNKKGAGSFIKYPFTFMAIIDLVSILPSLTIISKGFKVLRIIRMIRALRVLRLFKGLRYSKSIRILSKVMQTSKDPLIAVCIFAVGYIIVAALVIFNVEPTSFDNFFEAIYWSTVSLTTVGYGDIYPVTTIGRIVTMFSSVFGIAIIALPSGILTAGYMKVVAGENNN